jgi:hypothetical protein
LEFFLARRLALVGLLGILSCKEPAGGADAGVASASASASAAANAQAPIRVTLTNVTKNDTVRENAYSTPGSQSWTVKDGWDFLIVAATIDFAHCDDELESWGMEDEPDAGATKGMRVGNNQALLILPNGLRQATEGGGSDDRICAGCSTVSQLHCQGDAGNNTRFSFLFVVRESFDPSTAVLEFRDVRVPLSTVTSASAGDGGVSPAASL